MSAESGRRFRERNPWYNCFKSAKRRCDDVNHQSYKYCGGRGIKFRLTIEDVIFIWKRDNAHLMDRPSIDRIDADKDYVLDNVRFLEFLENSMRPHLKEEVCAEWTD